MKASCLGWVIVVLLDGVLAGALRAEELDFPKRCVELGKGPEPFLWPDLYSSRESVLFRMTRMGVDGAERSFVVWDTETGKLLARRPAPGSQTYGWQLSSDGKLLAVPVHGHSKIVQLWEVGSKDGRGIPQLRFLTELRPKDMPPKGQPEHPSPWPAFVQVAWTPDSKTLIARYNLHLASSNATPTSKILFWSYTDKPSVFTDSPDEDRGGRSWKPWAKLEFEQHLQIAVSPDNLTLAVMEAWSREPIGHLFDLQTAQLREKFPFDRDRAKTAPLSGSALAYWPEFSPDSKTLVISGFRYFGLWDTSPPAPRVELPDADFHEQWGHFHKIAFTSDSRWLLTLNMFRTNRHLGRDAVVQVRDAQTAKVHHEVGFPKQLGLARALINLPDHRLLLIFESAQKGHRQFLWYTDDLLRYAVEHGSPPK